MASRSKVAADKSTLHESNPHATVFFRPPSNKPTNTNADGNFTEFIKSSLAPNPAAATPYRGEETIAPGELNSLSPTSSGTFTPEQPSLPTEVLCAAISSGPATLILPRQACGP